MRLNTFCLCCQINKQASMIDSFPDEKKKLAYMQNVLTRLTNLQEDDNSPSLYTEFQKHFTKIWGIAPKDYTELKKEFNQLMMDLEEELMLSIRESADPLERALIYSRIGNYIDFAALSHVKKEELLSLIEKGKQESLDKEEYRHFCEELSSASSLVYLTDNCGEIVLDKLVIRILKERFPKLDIQVIVRGFPAANDATIEDAKMCGLTEFIPVIGNGNDVGGTWLPHISKESLSLIKNADVIISKGQGNFETLHGCALNIYYLFLCKCEWFMRMFQAEKFQGMFVNEKRIPSDL
ncbi:MAG: DUF89 family protein [Clostridiales bacterium]|nr:DUF89 family protein [Clostridiales bacterium]